MFKKIKFENENSLKDLSIKYTNLEDKLNKLVTQNDKIANEIKIIKENILDLQNADKNNSNLLNKVENDNKKTTTNIDNLYNKYNFKIKEIEEQTKKY